jgi:hypothetical protein
MGFKKTSAATVASSTDAGSTAAVVERNEPIGIALGRFESELAMSMDEDVDVTFGMLPPELQASITRLLTKFNISSQGDDALIFKFKAEKQLLQGGIVLAHADGVVIRFGDYEILVPAETDITIPPYSFSFDTDLGGKFILDRGGVTMEVRCFFDASYNAAIKTAEFSAKMMAAMKASDLCDYLARGERLHKWANEPENAKYTIHEISPVMDRDQPEKVAYAVLLAESETGEPIRLYAPGDYADYAGIDFSEGVEAVKTGYVFEIAGKSLKITSGGKYAKLAELTIDVEYKVVGFELEMNQFKNLQAKLTLEDGTIVNGNTPINRHLQGTPTDAISVDKPAILVVKNVTTSVDKSGKEKNFVTARLELFGAQENPMLANLKKRMAATKATPIANPL